MRGILGLCFVYLMVIFTTPASAQCAPGWGQCPGGCAPLGSVCCRGGTYCPAGNICTKERSCLRRNDPRVCRNGNYCYVGEYCGPDNRCYRQR